VNPELILRIISYVTASFILVLGIIVVGGFFLPDYVPLNFRIILGVIMIIYGLYRIAMIHFRRRNVRDQE
jgi:cytochrome c biogenesis protein CcdA